MGRGTRGPGGGIADDISSFRDNKVIGSCGGSSKEINWPLTICVMIQNHSRYFGRAVGCIVRQVDQSIVRADHLKASVDGQVPGVKLSIDERGGGR